MNKSERVIFSLLTNLKVVEIMNCVKKTYMTIPQISKATNISGSIVYRYVAQLEENEFLDAIPANTQKLGRVDWKYCRGKKYNVNVKSFVKMVLRNLME